MMKERARKYILPVLCFQIAIIGMQVYSMTQDTWWYCNVTVEAPIMNVTKDSVHRVKISIKMRTSLTETCWYVKQAEETSIVEYTLIARPITKCLGEDSLGFDLASEKLLGNSSYTSNTSNTVDNSSRIVREIDESKVGMDKNCFVFFFTPFHFIYAV